MLEQLIKSKTKKGILKLFISHENESFYLTQIADKISASKGTAQRELEKLVKFGILKSEKVGNLRYYSLDKENPAFEEYISIFKKTLALHLSLMRDLQNFSGIDHALIFGSYAKNEMKNDSDIDLIIIGSPNEDDLIKIIKKSENVFQREINYHLYSKNDFLSKYKKGSFLKNALKNYIYLSKNKNGFEKLLQQVDPKGPSQKRGDRH